MSIIKLVQAATKAPKGVTDLRAASVVTDESILALKSICKNDQQSIEDVSRYLLLDLTNRSAIVRLKSLSVIDALFFRSKLFRKEISTHIRLIAESAGFLAGKVIDCAVQRDALQHKVKELLEMWDMHYGEFLPEIRALTRHMKEFLRLEMPDINARALQHSEQMDKRQGIKENKVLARARHVLTELTPEIGKTNMLMEIRCSLSELNSCFDIIFPGVTESIERKPLSISQSMSSQNSIGFNDPPPKSQPIVWECDGEEVFCEDEKDDVAQSTSLSNNCNDDNDDDDVVWEDGVDDSDHEDLDDHQAEITSAPFTIEINLPMTAAGVETADNAIVLQTLREITSHLTTHSLPILSEWREALASALGVLNYRREDEGPSKKRKWGAVKLNAPLVDDTKKDETNSPEKEAISSALRVVCALDDEVQKVLRTRCRTLLGP